MKEKATHLTRVQAMTRAKARRCMQKIAHIS